MAAAVTGLLVAACGAEEDSKLDDRSARSKPALGEARGPSTPPPATKTPPRSGLAAAERCGGAIRVIDPVGDSRGVSYPEGKQLPLPPSADLRRFELRAGASGVCARWTTREPARPGTTFKLVAHGPFGELPHGGAIAHGHGFDVELVNGAARVTYGKQVLRGRVGQSGATVSAFVPRVELDRPPENSPDRPRFPYRAFTFEARVTLYGDRSPVSGGDAWPQGQDRPAAYIDGRLCEAPCTDRRLGRP